MYCLRTLFRTIWNFILGYNFFYYSSNVLAVQEVLSVPIYIRKNATPLRDQEGDHTCTIFRTKRMLAKYPGLSIRASSHASPVSIHPPSAALAIKDFQDVEYYGVVGIGTPKQTLNVLLDTGSSSFWVSGATTQLSDGSPSLQTSTTGPMFNASYSSSFRITPKTYRITYGDNSFAYGAIAKETISQGPYHVKNVSFGIVNETSSAIFVSDASGIMGMGFGELDPSGPSPFWSVAGIDTFAFGIARFNGSSLSASEPGGILTLGGFNNSLFKGPINYISVSHKGYWKIPLDYVIINGIHVKGLQNNSAVIDTGTNLIGAPSVFAKYIYGAIPGSQEGRDIYQGYYFIPCNSNVSLTFYFGGKAYEISPEDFSLDETSWDEQLCLGAVFSTDSEFNTDGHLWLMGTTFLKNVYTIFKTSTPSVGFAYPVDNYQYLLGGNHFGKGSHILKNHGSSIILKISITPFYSVMVSIWFFPFFLKGYLQL
ncbi:hypothetical protein CROQUDRAFT_658379 [Cronartium quercuum f. sp. fusiforme G11]|uniref:Peptidase A1 domain-containing protein n=1 Tax=Cronartium quercuum f. sp. fusiforme G11 TaxID=708437 RepID=A0A9P6NLI2_9BASI|nr:hypothetical protein CROQUDRAFT_658379 [Cronartium quercuum f. sp. fusiforme G11]